MTVSYSPPGPAIASHPIQAMLAQFPVVCFTLALITDVAFWQSSNVLWQNFSAWLLLAGLVFGGLAVLAWIVGTLFRFSASGEGPAWLRAIFGLVVLGLAFLNSLVHAGDGWTGVVPYGLALSALTVVLMLVAALAGGLMARRNGSR